MGIGNLLSAAVLVTHLAPISAADAPGTHTPLLDKALLLGKQRVERFFGSTFKQPFEVAVFRSRDEMDRYCQKRWGFKTERWMVASGVADCLAILEPSRWNSEAVDHDDRDARHVVEIVAHELVHVYHGQNNASHEFDGMDDLGWFVEGLATYASGQLENAHRQSAVDAVRGGFGPKTLASAWSGKFRYGVSGSMVQYIDKRWGRRVVLGLLAATQPSQALESLHTTEAAFLLSWRLWIDYRHGPHVVDPWS